MPFRRSSEPMLGEESELLRSEALMLAASGQMVSDCRVIAESLMIRVKRSELVTGSVCENAAYDHERRFRWEPETVIQALRP